MAEILENRPYGLTRTRHGSVIGRGVMVLTAAARPVGDESTDTSFSGVGEQTGATGDRTLLLQLAQAGTALVGTYCEFREGDPTDLGTVTLARGSGPEVWTGHAISDVGKAEAIWTLR